MVVAKVELIWLQVVLIHGLSVPAIVWKDVAPVLVARGFRVLLYGIFTQPLILMFTYLSILKISTGGVTLTHRKLPMIQAYIPHNLPILCNISDGRKQILSASQWYVRILIFGMTYHHNFRVVPLLRHSLHTFPTLLTKVWHLSRQRALWRYVYLSFLHLIL